MTKIDLITGMLGSGKTTFIHQYAEYFIRQGQKIAILENDFGAVNVDMMMLQDLKSENCQLEMIAGGGDRDCHQRRFKTQLISLGMQHIDRVIVEPSGIFDMDEFFDTLYEPPLDRWFTIGSILTLLDAETEEILSPQMEYLFASEAACAGRLIVSKICPEYIPEQLLSHLNHALEGIQCPRRFTADELTAKPWHNFTEQDFQLFSSAGYQNAHYVKQFNTDDLHSEVHYFMHVRIPEEKIRPMIETILNTPESGTIFRIKGALPRNDGGYWKINAVHDKTEISPVPEAQAVLIVIGEKMNFSCIDTCIRQNNLNPDYVSI